MNEATFDIKEAHRWFAIHCNNSAWDLLDQTERSEDENVEMIHLGHAAMFHWSRVGTVVQRQRSLCLLGNIFAELKKGTPAVEYGEACLKLIEKNPELMEDYDWAFGYECLARAYAAAGNRKESLEYRTLAEKTGKKIADPDDKRTFEESFATRNWHGVA